MPMFIFPQPGGSPLLSLLVGLAAISQRDEAVGNGL